MCRRITNWISISSSANDSDLPCASSASEVVTPPLSESLADELQRRELRKLVAADLALHDAAQMLRDRGGGDPLRQQRIVLRRDRRSSDRIDVLPLSPARQCARSYSFGMRAPFANSTLDLMRARSSSVDTMPICSLTYLRVPPPPAGPLVYRASTSSPMIAASSARARARRRHAVGPRTAARRGRTRGRAARCCRRDRCAARKSVPPGARE